MDDIPNRATPKKFVSDEVGQLVLAALAHNSGPMTTTDVREWIITDEGRELDNDYIRRRFEWADEAGLVNVDQVPAAEHARPGIPPMRAELTEKGNEKIEDGLISDVFSPTVDNSVSIDRSQFREFKDTIERLENRLDTIVEYATFDKEADENGGVAEEELESVRLSVSEVQDEIMALRADVDKIEERVAYLEERNGLVEKRIGEDLFTGMQGLYQALDAEFGINAREYIPDE